MNHVRESRGCGELVKAYLDNFDSACETWGRGQNEAARDIMRHNERIPKAQRTLFEVENVHQTRGKN